MKKIYLSILMLLSLTQIFAQANLVVQAPLHDNTANINRAPNGTAAHTYYNAAFLVLQDELRNIPSGTSITQFGFTLSIGTTGSAASGNFTVYLQNTADNTYQKGTNFPAAISGMTQVYANVMTVPLTAGSTSVFITLSTPFTYTGGGLYVAYDWLGTSFSTGAAGYLGEVTRLPLPGGAGVIGFGATSAPSTLTLTATRPSFLFGFTNNNSNDVEVFTILAQGRTPAMLASAQTVTALVRNLSNTGLTNINVTLNVSGANTFNNTQTVTSLGAGVFATVQFPGFNPVNPGINTLSVSVSSDQNNLNNSTTYTQNVTCNEWSNNPPQGNYTLFQVGFNTGAGILSTSYYNPVSSTLIAVRAAISTNTASVGQNVYGVLQSNTGNIIATSNTVSITSPMLGNYITFTFSPQPLSAGISYNLGMAQTIGSVGYFPYGTVGAHYLPLLYAYTGITGGAYVTLTANYGYFGIHGIFMPNIQLSVAPQVISCGSTATLQAISSTNYSWSTGAITSSIVVNSPTVNTQYTVTATNTIGCSVSTVAVLNVTPFPLSITSSSATICLGNPVSLSVSGGVTYTWSTNSNASTINELPNVTTQYTVGSKNLAGCMSSTAIIVSVQSFSNLTVSPTTTTICKGGQVNFLAGSSASYTWNTGTSLVNTPSLNATPVASESYTITGADALGCTMSRTVNITVNSTTIIATPDTSICRGTTITLSASGATNYVWNSTFSFATLPVSPSVATVYFVTGNGPTGCPGSSSLTVSVNENPTVTASATRTLMCKNDKNTITASGATTYSWSNGASGPSIVITPTNTLPPSYTVTGYSPEGCKSSVKISITVSNCTGLSDQTALDYRIFPNPTSGAVYLELGETAEPSVVEVYSALGQLIHRESTSNEIYQLNLREQANGVYIIKVTRNNSLLGTTRLIKN